ncbi:MAG: hypothetical protein ABSG05_03420 [Candidatus Pacearchaeota archaeon]|jgi:hypothetical protein
MIVPAKRDDGSDDEMYIDETLKENLEAVKNSVLKRGWDYLAIVAGIPGTGKSTFTQQICKFLDPSFNAKDRICFTGTGENGLIERTASPDAKTGMAFMLDESFESLNSRVSSSAEFLRIVNHLQLIRQKGLFIILCLPNFFDLSKGIAIFRTSHLFVVYSDSFERGYFAAFGRDEKRKLYVKGNKFVDYNAEKPNFRGRYTKKWIADWDLYEKMKGKHLIEQSKNKQNQDKKVQQRNKLIVYLKEKKRIPAKEISEICGLSRAEIYKILEEYSDTSEENDGEVSEKHG